MRAILFGLFVLVSCLSVSAKGDTLHEGLLFYIDAENGLNATFSKGDPTPIFASGVAVVESGPVGNSLDLSPKLSLAWPAAQNIYAKHGTITFWVRVKEGLSDKPLPLFRVSSADSSTWDFTWLRIDWNGKGVDAFVTDTNLARLRLSSFDTVTEDDWLHVAFGWDEDWGGKLWLNGKLASKKQQKSALDQGLWGFGPVQRIVAPWSVHSAYNMMIASQFDEIRIYDRLLTSEDVYALFSGQSESILYAAPQATSLLTRQRRLGFTPNNLKAIPLARPFTRVKKVAFSDTRDQLQAQFKGADGIRETTWPGIYNRADLPGRNDYFILPDWNVYSTSGYQYDLTLVDEHWNHLEITGSAFGELQYGGQLIGSRPEQTERTTHHFSQSMKGGKLTFLSKKKDMPIQEIAAYLVDSTPPSEPVFSLAYKLQPAVKPKDILNLAEVIRFVEGRYAPDERSLQLVAMPDWEPLRYKPPKLSNSRNNDSSPVVHIMIPADFRDVAPGSSPTRLSYGWKNMQVGLDGITLSLPELYHKDQGAKAEPLPINIRLKDPLWPARDLIDVNLKVTPGQTHTIWLDIRDRILPSDKSLYFTLASDEAAFSGANLSDMAVTLSFKTIDLALPEHIADHLEQARDNLANLVEEQPNIRLFPVWDRFEKDISAVLRYVPDNQLARSLWVEKNPEQPYTLDEHPTPTDNVPEWAWYQKQLLTTYREFVNWWIDHRQLQSGPGKGEFGGGLSDDTDLTNHWVPLALMGVDSEKVRRSQLALLKATHNNGMWQDGLNRIKNDELHAYEEGVNALAQAMQLNWGQPDIFEQALDVVRNYPRLIETNPEGHAHFISFYFSQSDIDLSPAMGWQKNRSYLITHPGLLLVDYNGASPVKNLLLRSLDDWIAHRSSQADNLPAQIQWQSDKATGSGVGLAVHNFWAAYRWTKDEKYLAPIIPRIADADLSAVSEINANIVTELPDGNRLIDAIIKGELTGRNNYIDRNLGGITTRDFADYIRWNATGDTHILASLYKREWQQAKGRLPYLTEAEAWTDRVSMATEALQRTRLGGVSHKRNAYYPGNLVSWLFTQNGQSIAGDEVALLLRQLSATSFEVTSYGFSKKEITAHMTGWDLTPGVWQIKQRGQNQQTLSVAKVYLARGETVDLPIAPGRTQSFEFSLIDAEPDPSERVDIAISANDITLADQALEIVVHNLSMRNSPQGTVYLVDETGTTLSSTRFDAMPSVIDLLPKRQTVSIPLPDSVRGSDIQLTLVLDGQPEEISLSNNKVGIKIPTHFAIKHD